MPRDAASFTRCTDCKMPNLCIQKLECFAYQKRSIADIEKDLAIALKGNRTNVREKRIRELQQRSTLSPGEGRELDLLLDLKWREQPPMRTC